MFTKTKSTPGHLHSSDPAHCAFVSWLTWTAGHISWIAEITTEKMFHSFTVFYSGLVNKRNLSGGYAGHFFAALDSSIETLSVQIWKCVHLYIYRTPVHSGFQLTQEPIVLNGEHEITPELTQELSGLGSVQCWKLQNSKDTRIPKA